MTRKKIFDDLPDASLDFALDLILLTPHSHLLPQNRTKIVEFRQSHVFGRGLG